MWNRWKIGFFILLPPICAFFAGSMLWGFFKGLPLNFFENDIYNVLLKVLVLIILPLSVGNKKVRAFIIWRSRRNKKISWFLRFFLGKSFSEKVKSKFIKENTGLEVLCPVVEGSFINRLCIVSSTSEVRFASGIVKKMTYLTQCSSPFALTGPIFIVPDDCLVYTGNSLKETVLTVGSFGLRFRLSRLRNKLEKPSQ